MPVGQGDHLVPGPREGYVQDAQFLGEVRHKLVVQQREVIPVRFLEVPVNCGMVECQPWSAGAAVEDDLGGTDGPYQFMSTSCRAVFCPSLLILT